MKKDISFWQTLGFLFTAIAGTLLHFLYEFTNYNPIAAWISGVNESTWEHMKLLYFPLFLVAVLQRGLLQKHKNFWRIKLLGTTLGLLSIPVLFYTYNGAIGPSPDWLNITIFFVAAALTFWSETRLFQRYSHAPCNQSLYFAVFCFIGVLFLLFTFLPPRLPLFMDPITHTYGVGVIR